MRTMLIIRIRKYLRSSLLLSVTYCTTAFGQTSPDFSGDWGSQAWQTRFHRGESEVDPWERWPL